MTRIKRLKWPSQSLVNRIAIIALIVLCIYGATMNYYRLVSHTEDTVLIKAKVTDKIHLRDKWSLRIDYWFCGEIYHASIGCTKDNFRALSPGDSIIIKINKKRPDNPFHIHDGIIGSNEVF